MKVLLTGASGFVGSALSVALARSDVEIERLSFSKMLAGRDVTLSGAPDVCIHLAARVHMMGDKAANPLFEFRRCNVNGTIALARQAAAAGVRRFVFISSIKVNGEFTESGRPFLASDVPAPQDAYGLSKYEAEAGLREVGLQTGMEIVVIRPPLVYGPGVKANFAAMMSLIYRGVPLPIGSVRNKRSLVGLDNLVSLIEVCAVHPAAANQTFLVSDGMDLSTSELARGIGEALGKQVRMIPVPELLLNFGARLLGKREVAQRLCESLQVDISKTREALGWTPPVTIEEGLKRTAESWISSLSK